MDKCTKILQNFHLTLIQGSILFWAYIQEHFPSKCQTVTKHTNDLFAGLIIIIGRSVTPGSINRSTEFPDPFRSTQWNFLLRSLIISISLQPGVYNNFRIHRFQISLKFLCLPLFCTAFPVSVKPQKINFPIICHQFVHLIIIEFQKFLPFFWIFRTTCRSCKNIFQMILRIFSFRINRTISGV